MKSVVTLTLFVIAALAWPGPASAAKSCSAPGAGTAGWERATPAEAGMDAARLQDAVDYATTELSTAVRVYRRGCLVAADRQEPLSRQYRSESWSLAKSVTALVFGRAMTLGLISPDDPVGSLIPEADKAHGAITARQLLTMTSGLRWNGFRDYNIFMADRLRDFLTVEVVRPPGTWFEYSQTGPFTLAEAISRAAGEDFQAFAQRELFSPLGIAPGTWSWRRDGRGRTQGFFGIEMTADDYGRFGDLMRRGGLWDGKRLLSKRFVRAALTPTLTNGCYGWLIWLNAAKPCIAPTVTERPVNDRQNFPGLPADLYRFSGLFGQLVSTFPSQDLVVVRTGQESDAINFSGGAGYEDTLYRKVLGAITDQAVTVDENPPSVPGDAGQENPDKGFQYSFSEPDEYGAPFGTGGLPEAGPFRQRAAMLSAGAAKGRAVRLRVGCPRRARRPCRGTATLAGARRPRGYALAPGTRGTLRFTLERMPRRVKSIRATAVNADKGGGTPASLRITVGPRG